LPGDQLAASHGNFILLDSTAVGNGWFVDQTSNDDLEFSSAADGSLVATDAAAIDDIDALTAIMHEMGHMLAKDDLAEGAANQLMLHDLPVGVRRLTTSVYGSLDVNRDGKVSSLDALVIINRLAEEQLFATSTTPQVADGLDPASMHYDVNKDDRVTALDALQIINQLGRVAADVQPEQEQATPVIAFAPNLPTHSSQIDSVDDDLLNLLADDYLSPQLKQ
jgi:hypothetical protein